ncbi:translation elongation factor G [Fimbriimonas ginsengisoli Gsoil 348]|uniref:Translation elongation factor G n=1 Tax=Fimbriimonas ginsengisoli Gsoil 348 TaxID=661478 RepID=A0A068NYA6_FIMGI|nr:translation elongation factor G [Fimbriimonas ginsengisoli Gsoil 348]
MAIVGHGGAGKTMLVEHLLYTAGATDRVGSVDAGNTQSDYDPLEIRRKISLNASIVPIEWHGCKINLIDVPGYPDFIGDLHGVARVVESMIIVCEAKRDLDVGFDLAFEVAQEHGLATCIFVNKLERDNADFEGLMETLHERFGRKVVSTQIPIGHQAAFSGVLDLLNMKVYKGKDRGVEIEEVPSGYTEEAAERRDKMMDAAAEGDDDLAMKYLEGESLSEEEIEHGLLVGIETGRVIPVLVGSAMSGIGVATLLDRICGELPSPIDLPKMVPTPDGESIKIETDPAGPLAAFVFKTTADPFVGKINFIRVFSGTLKADQHVLNVNRESDERVHNLFYPHGKGQENATEVVAGDIAAVAKLAHTHTGDTLSTAKDRIMLPPINFPESIYRVAIVPVTKADEDKLGTALGRLLEEDPTLRHTRDTATHQEILEGMGDIHLDTVVEKLKAKFGVNVKTEEARVPYRETVKSQAKAQGRHKRQTGGKGQFGDCWIELEPLGRGEGFVFENKVVGGAIPKNFIPAIEKGIREAMDHGLVAGYPAVDLKVIVYDGSYHDVDSSEMAFKTAGALALRAAAEKAQPVVLEPTLTVDVDVPDECVGDVVGDLNGRRGRLQGMDPIGAGRTRVHASVPMSTMTRYALDLRSITKGRGRFSQRIDQYDEIPYPEQQTLMAEYAKRRSAEAEH